MLLDEVADIVLGVRMSLDNASAGLGLSPGKRGILSKETVEYAALSDEG